VISRLDLSDQQSIRDFAAEQTQKLKRQKQSLDVLVNNAGVPTMMLAMFTSCSSSATCCIPALHWIHEASGTQATLHRTNDAVVMRPGCMCVVCRCHGIKQQQ
jgi:NAD(P)-dependent dehydrogenase (short-subunit alcohol dehydrogenase family)